MGIHVAGDALNMDRLVQTAIRGVGADIEDAHVPHMLGVVLAGGYARGEGGVFEKIDGTQTLYNDLDFYVVAEPDASSRNIRAIGRALAPVAERWTKLLGVDVDFSQAKTPWRLKHDEDRLMIQEMVHGYFDVVGATGEDMFKDIRRLEPSELPWTEAVRLLVNRGMGLMLSVEKCDIRFTARNINKCVLGAGDARLIARGNYAWRIQDRATALGNLLYSAAVKWKFRPRKDCVCRWDAALDEWMDAFDEVMETGRRTGAMQRSIYQTVRWIVRRRSIGSLRSVGYDPVVRMLLDLNRLMRKQYPVPPSLRRDWDVFN